MDVNLSIHFIEDDVETVAVAQLDLRDDHFEARGRARRNPVDPARPTWRPPVTCCPTRTVTDDRWAYWE